MREVVENAGGQVPTLAGADFTTRRGGRTTMDLANPIKEVSGRKMPMTTRTFASWHTF
jgi:hypothetical protein